MAAYSEEWVRRFLDSVPAALVSVDNQGRLAWANRQAASLFAYRLEDLAGQPAETLLAESDRAALAARLKTGRSPSSQSSGETTFEARGLRADGSQFPVEFRLSLLDEADGPRMLALVSDLTEQHRVRQALERTTADYEQLMESVRAIVWRGDIRTFQFTYVSPYAETLLGYPLARWTTEPTFWQDHIHPDDREWAVSYCLQASQEKKPYEFDYRMIAADGRAVWLHDLVRVSVEQDRPVELIGLMVDITARKKTEEALQATQEHLRQSQKMEAIGRLAGGIAHDYNNMLMTILGNCDLLLARLGGTEPMREDVEEIKKAGKRAAQLTRQLLAFSRKQVLQPKELDLNVLIGDMRPMLRPVLGENIELDTVLQTPLGWVRADRGQIEQTILNLAMNARDAMPKGGKLTIKTFNVEQTSEQVEKSLRRTPGAYVALQVSDTGVGMDAYTREHCFEPFFSTKDREAGSGLGLATVYGVVKQSGGSVEVASEPGQGATFTIFLPRVEGPAEEAAGVGSPAGVLSGTETILLAEDELMVRGVTREMLRQLGYTVLEASNGDEGLQASRGHGGRIHLLLTDVIMPGMNGRELAERVLAERPETRVLFMSGYTDDALLSHGALESGTALLQKPFSQEVLARKVREMLDAPPKSKSEV
ncbi:MAG: PAS domain S-box protein [Nitrospirota bacterium]